MPRVPALPSLTIAPPGTHKLAIVRLATMDTSSITENVSSTQIPSTETKILSANNGTVRNVSAALTEATSTLSVSALPSVTNAKPGILFLEPVSHATLDTLLMREFVKFLPLLSPLTSVAVNGMLLKMSVSAAHSDSISLVSFVPPCLTTVQLGTKMENVLLVTTDMT